MTEPGILLGTSVAIALIHTLIGVDHYVPFIALGRANNWPPKKTVFVVLLCGIGHVAGSVLLGFFGIALFSGVSSLVSIESMRGEIATWALIAFGLVYTIYGLRRAVKNKAHTHVGRDGQAFFHSHLHNDNGHEHDAKKNSGIFWGLFIFFVLGPCEPLVPLLMYPAAAMNIPVLVLVTVTFSVCTIAVMLLMTLLGLKGSRLLRTEKLERYAHALAGSAILLCGIMVLALPI